MANSEEDSHDPLLDVTIDINEFGLPIESLKNPPPSIEQETGSDSDGDASEPPMVRGPLDEINDKLDNLFQAFETKIQYDQHKNKIIDELHQALQEYRQGVLQKYVARIFMDVLKVVDDIRKFTVHIKMNPAHEEISDKCIQFLESTASELEDLFAWEGITPYVCEGDRLDLSRQRVLNKIQTADPEKDKLIAERVRPGYEYNGKIIRPEIVSVFVCQPSRSAED